MIRFIRILATSLLFSLTVTSSVMALTVAEVTDVTPKVDEPPAPVKTVAPEYPGNLRAAKVSGIVSVVLVVDEKGDVLAAEVGKSTHDDFKEPALDAVRRWKFKPAKLAGKPVKVRVTIPVRFTGE